MKVIYANIMFFIIVLYGLLSAALMRLASSFWQSVEMGSVKTEYDYIAFICAIWLVVTVVGLIMKKPWAYVHAQSIDAVIAVVPIIFFCVTTFILLQVIDHLEALKDYVYDLLFSGIAFAFWVTLYKSSSVKSAYNKTFNFDAQNNVRKLT